MVLILFLFKTPGGWVFERIDSIRRMAFEQNRAEFVFRREGYGGLRAGSRGGLCVLVGWLEFGWLIWLDDDDGIL